MANYICNVRSNYVHVKDKQAFETFLESFECKPIYDNEGRIGFYVDNMDGCAPYRYDDDTDEHQDLLDAALEIGSHLREGEVLVVEEAGWEKSRYLCGYSYAVNDKGRTLSVDMSSALRKKVEAEWGKADYTEATY